MKREFKIKPINVLLILIIIGLIVGDYFYYLNHTNDTSFVIIQLFWFPIIMVICGYLEDKYKTFTRLSKWMTTTKTIKI